MTNDDHQQFVPGDKNHTKRMPMNLKLMNFKQHREQQTEHSIFPLQKTS
jgi:hypothetical protein